MAVRFGAGPFYVNENIRLSWGEHRGEPTAFVHSSAYGQWGHLMVELFRQEDASTNTPYRDMFAANEEGLHHAAMMVPDMEEAFCYFESHGMPVVTRCGLREGRSLDFAFIDARTALGHMIEIYPRSEGVLEVYRFIRDAARNWSGKDPVRSL